MTSKQEIIGKLNVWIRHFGSGTGIRNESTRMRILEDLRTAVVALSPVETSDVDKRLSDEYFRGWHDGFSSAEGGPRAAARQDLAYYNGAQQAAAMAHQSLKNMDAWIAGGCGNRWTEAKRELAGSSVEPKASRGPLSGGLMECKAVEPAESPSGRDHEKSMVARGETGGALRSHESALSNGLSEKASERPVCDGCGVTADQPHRAECPSENRK